jgi:hypothetical protein
MAGLANPLLPKTLRSVTRKREKVREGREGMPSVEATVSSPSTESDDRIIPSEGEAEGLGASDG